MTKRIVLAALLGGLAMFAWESAAHMLLPLGEAGLRALPNEQPILAAVKDHIPASGFYFFPAPEDRPDMTSQQKAEAMAKAEERWVAGPSGILVAHPNGTPFSMPLLLSRQFAVDVLAMLVAAILVAQSTGLTYGKRVVFVAMIGLIPSLSVEIPHWNWYGFPVAWTAAQGITHVVGFICGGLVVAGIIRARS